MMLRTGIEGVILSIAEKDFVRCRFGSESFIVQGRDGR
jgi:hypothetical protein